jgi:long-chain acyl-CoA synthetase
MMPNVAEVPVVYYGVLRAGGVVVPMNPLLKGREVAYYLGDSKAGLVFAWHTFANEARDGAEQAGAQLIVVDSDSFPDLLASAAPDDAVADADDEDTAVILYTSGTTGHPKGAELTHGNLTSNTGCPARTSSARDRTTSSSAGFRCSTCSGRPSRSTSRWRRARA